MRRMFEKLAHDFADGLSGGQSQRCPDCDHTISSEDINIKEGVALCPNCGKLARLSELNQSGRSRAEILSHPPSGCSLDSDSFHLRATASLRSLSGFIFPMIFALFWNSIVSVFVLIAIAGLYSNLIGPLPAEVVPAEMVEDGKPLMGDAPMGLGETLFLCLFLTPFVMVGIGMTAVALLNLLGKVEVVIEQHRSYVATGVWFLQWKRKFDPQTVTDVGFGKTPWQSDGQSSRLIEIQGHCSLKFGSMLKPEAMEWMHAVLNCVLRPQSGQHQPAEIKNLSWLLQKKDR